MLQLPYNSLMTKLSTAFFKNSFNTGRNILLYLLIYCLVQQCVYQSRVYNVVEWTFGTAFNRVQLIVQLMESVSSRLCTGQRKTF